MGTDWRDTLRSLIEPFQSRAARSGGLHHLFVEAADNERDKLAGPSWFESDFRNTPVVDGKPQYRPWDVSAFTTFASIPPGFREPAPDEECDESVADRLVRDGSGVVRAVAVPMKLRSGYFCGCPSDDISYFKSLANAAAHVLVGAESLQGHVFAAELTDIFRKPRGGVRYVFGEVGSVPSKFIARGWTAGVLRFENGVLIDVPVSESASDSDTWLLLLHRLGWRRIEGSGLQAERKIWDRNVELAYESSREDWSGYPEPFVRRFSGISRKSYYSILGTRDAPLDINLASVLAIRLLLDDASPESLPTKTQSEPPTDYSREAWKQLKPSSSRVVTQDECVRACQPKIGILVATEVERQAVLNKLRPPKHKQLVFHVHVGANTYFVGRLGITDVALCMSAVGSMGRDGSTIVTSEMIEAWGLSGVIMPGIAFGKDPAKQAIGNVLVSEAIISYEPERIGKSTSQERGSRTVAGPVLLDRFRTVFSWAFETPHRRPCGFQVGPILSGEKLVDNFEFKTSLFDRFPTAIGGEMEGTGVAAAAERKRCEWIVVKAICDWGDGTKSKEHQKFAAAASVDFVQHVLNQPGALDALIRQRP